MASKIMLMSEKKNGDNPSEFELCIMWSATVYLRKQTKKSHSQYGEFLRLLE